MSACSVRGSGCRIICRVSRSEVGSGGIFIFIDFYGKSGSSAVCGEYTIAIISSNQYCDSHVFNEDNAPSGTIAE